MHQRGSRGSQEASILTRPVTLDKHASGLQYLHLENGGLGYMVPETSPSPTPGVPSSQGRATEGGGAGGSLPAAFLLWLGLGETVASLTPKRPQGSEPPSPLLHHLTPLSVSVVGICLPSSPAHPLQGHTLPGESVPWTAGVPGGKGVVKDLPRSCSLAPGSRQGCSHRRRG